MSRHSLSTSTFFRAHGSIFPSQEAVIFSQMCILIAESKCHYQRAKTHGPARKAHGASRVSRSDIHVYSSTSIVPRVPGSCSEVKKSLATELLPPTTSQAT